MPPEPSFESLCFNPFLVKGSLNDTNQDPDVNFYNDISSVETNYLSPCEANNKLKSFTSETFSILHLNIRSMNKNFEAFREFYESLDINFSIICFSETWANDSNFDKNSSFQIEGYNPIHQIRKNRKGSGIAIFIRNSLLYKVRDDLSINCDDIESLSIEIVNDHTKNIIINVVYRPPDGDLSICETFFRKILSENSNANKTLFLAGDFNINVLDYENNKKVQNFVNLMFEFSMIPTINKPTRVTSYTATAIDNIITNSILDKDFKSAIIKTDFSDHFSVIFVIKLKTKFSPNNQVDQFIFKRDFNENTLTLFKQNLFETSWDSVKKIDDPNESYNKFLEIFSSLYEKYFPFTKVKLKPKRKNSPWITNGIAKSSKRKQKLYEKFLKHRTQESKQIYKDYKNLFEIIKRKSKKQFYSEKLMKFQGNAKKTWPIMKELIGKNKIYKSSFPQKIVIDTTEIVGETKIANEFNNFFTNKGPKLVQKIPQPSRRFQSYMKSKL